MEAIEQPREKDAVPADEPAVARLESEEARNSTIPRFVVCGLPGQLAES